MTPRPPTAILANVANQQVPHTVGVREVNTQTVLDILRRHRQTTRTELLHLSGLSKATVSVIVADLIERGFATETGKIQQGRGRSRIALEFNPLSRTVVGVQIEDARCHLVLTDLYGQQYQHTSEPLHGTDQDIVLASVVRGFEEIQGLAASPVIGLGVGAPGHVDREGRRIRVAVSHNWRDLPIADILEDRLRVPVVVANRAKVAALAEIGPDTTDLVYIFLGRGVVAGIVVDGQLVFGRDGGAGDIGHVTVQPDGDLCGCGSRGCLHTVAGEVAILARARARAREVGKASLLHTLCDGHLNSLTLPMLAHAAHDNDSAAVSTLDDVGSCLGIVVGNLVNTLNPEAVVIGGPGAQLGEPLLAPIRREIRRRALSEACEKLEVTKARDNTESAAVGAATLWLNRSLAASLSRAVFTDRRR